MYLVLIFCVYCGIVFHIFIFILVFPIYLFRLGFLCSEKFFEYLVGLLV